MSVGNQKKYSRRLLEKRRGIALLLVLPISFMYIEAVTRICFFGFLFNIGLILVPMCGFLIGCVFSLISTFMGRKKRYVFTAVMLGLAALLHSIHIVYFGSMRSVLILRALGMANAVKDFFSQTVYSIVMNSYKIVLIALPFVFFLVFIKKYYFKKSNRVIPRRSIAVITAVTAAITVALSASLPDTREAFAHFRYDINNAFSRYGIAVSTVLDLSDCVFGTIELDPDNPYDDVSSGIGSDTSSDAGVVDTSSGQTGSDTPSQAGASDTTSASSAAKPAAKPSSVDYGYNKLNIDFDALAASAPNNTIRSLHKYVASVPASNKNEYTGMFKGKNLIFLTLEGFSYKVIDEQLTPTLYKMFNEGFRFTNFYDTQWGGSTATGEYSNMTGNFYDSANCLKKSAKTLQYSSLGNMFKRAGYPTLAYHNHTYTYYGRNLSHPNFGYTYKGIGNGLKMSFNGWPRSDFEMAQLTAPDMLALPEPFHVYYMTVSGHANYTWMDNSMSSRHRKDIPDSLPYCANVKAYLACNYEVELMLTELVQRLEAAGKLENTVFAMCCDHFPYALSTSELAELYGLPEENVINNFDLYRNAFILWSASMKEPITVDTPCSSIDMVPTLANLFGLEFDSRVIAGKDILSDAEKIAILNIEGGGTLWNWITTEGKYSTMTKKFTPSESNTMTDKEIADYVEITNRKVAAMRRFCFNLLDQDYYRYVFDANGKPLKTTVGTPKTSTVTSSSASVTSDPAASEQ